MKNIYKLADLFEKKIAKYAQTTYSDEEASKKIQELITRTMMPMLGSLKAQGINCWTINVALNVLPGPEISFDPTAKADPEEQVKNVESKTLELLNKLIPNIKAILKKYNVDTLRFNIDVDRQ